MTEFKVLSQEEPLPLCSICQTRICHPVTGICLTCKLAEVGNGLNHEVRGVETVTKANELLEAIKVLAVEPGSHLIVKTKYREDFEASWEALRYHLPENTIVFFVDELGDIGTISEEGKKKLDG